ncbi:MAG: hypothetical protein DMD60_06020 [Gemmatimonadetes bacterium]|nr:MAG: hypothetical protein DMD60_06020 [Gemmatimonadota bacterium]
MSVSLPPDEDGMLARECEVDACSPAYFKVRPGTGITEGQAVMYCPYCRTASDPSHFHTREQIRYAQDLAKDEALKGVDRMVQKALGLGSSPRKKLVDGLISVELEYTPGQRPMVRRPLEEELRRDIRCRHCGLDHAVFGLAIWCPDCGRDVFIQHVEAEFASVSKMLEELPTRRERLGHRVAARDLENSLEDVVSIFEAVLKIITRRNLQTAGKSSDQIEEVVRRNVRNSYQNVASAENTYRDLVGAELFGGISQQEKEHLSAIFEKRHPITHNLGVVDRRYLDRARSGELEGREVRVTGPEVAKAIELSLLVLGSAYRARFPFDGSLR